MLSGMIRKCAALVALVAVALPARAAELDKVIARGELVWAADQEGGGPHVFLDPKDPGRLTGFEVELAGLVAAELGVKPRFQQGQWDRLPLLLGRAADCVINGIELIPERRRDYHCSRPYFAYSLQLLARREGPLDSLEQVQSGVLDAAVMDDCIFNFYADRFAGLRMVGRPFGGGLYTILTAKDTPRLSAAIDEALGKIIADGRLKALYDRWDLAGRQQVLALRDAAEIPTASRRSLAELARESLPLLLKAAGMTVLLSCVAFPLAMLIGLFVAIARLHGPVWLKPLLAGYVEVLRGTPLMLQLYAIFFLLPKIGLALPALVAAVAGLALNYSAYESEIYRAGLKAVPLGQFEAALSLGMTKWQALRHVIVPQAVRLVMPPVTNDFIALFKDTSVCSVITVIELTKRYSVLALSTGRIVELAIVTALLYLAMSWPLSLVSRWFEGRLEKSP